MYDFSKYIDESKASIEKLNLPADGKVSLFIKRIDLVHPVISGNKWFKMKYNIAEMKKTGIKTLVTFGGAYSNHIHAVAEAGNIFGFNTIGLIRGEEHLPLNPTLDYAVSRGMELHYVDRTSFRRRDTEEFTGWIKSKFGNAYILPVGGSNALAVKGCAEIIGQIDIDFDYICCACGSGGTLAGLIEGLSGQKFAIGIPALKGGKYLKDDINKLIHDYSGKRFSNWELQTEYHFGGFGKVTKELADFINIFEELNDIKIEPLYTAKMLYGLNDLVQKKYFPDNSCIIALHTGGLQGIPGMAAKINKLQNTRNPK
jgi:1-aminocyclopropane-1-carboxylate deaminase/D-cysteine desulfhydrase-like pyridoxal-dependent ACC family enzyme